MKPEEVSPFFQLCFGLFISMSLVTKGGNISRCLQLRPPYPSLPGEPAGENLPAGKTFFPRGSWVTLGRCIIRGVCGLLAASVKE